MNRWQLPIVAVAVLALAACGKKTSQQTPPPPPGRVVVTQFEAASTLIGQPDWTTAPSVACTASSLTSDPGGPLGAIGWDGTDLLVPDTDGGRLLAFDPIPPPETNATAAPIASFVIGQVNATTCQGANGTLGFPQAPSVSGGRLVASDSAFMQVYVWDTVPTTWDASPARTFGDGTTDCSATGLNDPRGAIVVGSDVVIADALHNRVLVYPLSNASAPRLVLGQVESANVDPFDRCAANDVNGDASVIAPAATTMRNPTAVWSDGVRLMVADTDNHRILVWNTFPTASTAPADLVIGQTALDAASAGAGASGLKSPQSIASDGEQLFVADTGNNRVLVYATIPTANGAGAALVLGQGDFAHVAPNDDLQDGTTVRSARTLSGPTGVAVVDGLLAVTDTGNGRVLIYRPAP